MGPSNDRGSAPDWSQPEPDPSRRKAEAALEFWAGTPGDAALTRHLKGDTPFARLHSGPKPRARCSGGPAGESRGAQREMG